MYLDFCPWYLLARGMVIMFLIAMFFVGALHIFTNIIKNKDLICDSEKQSKFILECIKEDKTKTVGAITDCERIAIKLFCK